ncbi:hypothetical protein HWX16_21020 [Ochrobactrum intermedium]|uniref:hypothetical protein n=1 Tax=Brucella intermedia TaxID=94625 RepID=UPI00159C96F7|nr:hypothetical protein [Brucella intermedia]NVM42799.1 hypothetical protein [Brucella intermedia]QTN04518.1 hypothetical protein GTN27_14900 [Ochrobactrum sp. EEELCW01]
MNINKDDKRIVIGCGFIDDELSAAISGREIHIEIDCPFAGDSISGIGRSTSTYLSPEAATELGSWLMMAGKAIGKGRSS